MAKDLAPKIEHDLLACPLHQVGLDELKAKGEEQCAEIQTGKLGDAGHRRRAEVPGKPGEVGRSRTGHVVIDRNLHQKGASYVGRGLKENRKSRESSLKRVRTQVPQQAPHEAAIVGFACNLI